MRLAFLLRSVGGLAFPPFFLRLKVLIGGSAKARLPMVGMQVPAFVGR